MKILHIALSCPFTHGHTYQENLLTKAHRDLNHEVYLITTDFEMVEGNIKRYIGELNYTFNKIHVLRKRMNSNLFKSLSYANIKHDLELISPDFVFFHGLCSFAINQVVKYKKLHNKNLRIVIDSHEDIINSPTKNKLKSRLKFYFFQHLHKKNMPFIEKVYGVTPGRIQFAIEKYKISKEKTDLLIMGADDNTVNLSEKKQIREKIRKEHQVDDKCFLIVTGGKINKDKKIIQLMEAVKTLNNVKLFIFGSIEKDIEVEFNTLLKNNNITYLGWLNDISMNNYFHAADLIAFPGTHSVLWEQACATKTPCIFRFFNGIDHVNNNGSCAFFKGESIEEIKNDIKELIFTEKYAELYKKSNSELTDIFLYSNIAKKSLL